MAIRALGSVQTPGARDYLLARLHELERTAARADAETDDFIELQLFERAALIEALASVQPAPEWLARAWLRHPRERARRDLTTRFVGDKLAATEFRWRTELVFAGAAAAEGQLAGALAHSAGWERIDGRCLAELGAVALARGGPDTRPTRPSRATGRALLAAALVALAGEGAAPDLAAVLLFTHRRAWLAAERAEDWPAVGVHARALLDLRGRGAVSEVRWAAEFGEFDPGRGRDPGARVRSSLQHAEGRIDAAAAGR